MKILLAIIILFISKSIFAETLSCSYSFEGESQSFVLERVDQETFKWVTTSNKTFFIDILWEDESRILFASVNTYGSVEAFYTMYYDKVSKRTQSNLLSPANEDLYSIPPSISKCIEF
jgi:hypothetical protein